MKRWYVTKTWDDWPEGGSYGTIIEADSYEAAEGACLAEMADSRASEGSQSAQYYINEYGDEWYTVDCFDLDEFIAQHTKPKVRA